ncbi:MAG: hypothetical protein LRY50_10225 [Geovibrio sp.]|nr:hypothetical protein [Geovibrio sp.]
MAAPLDFEAPIIEIENKIAEIKNMSSLSDSEMQKEMDSLQKRLERVKANIYQRLTPSQKLMVARHPERPYTLDFIKLMFTDFLELHGDRLFRDDQALSEEDSPFFRKYKLHGLQYYYVYGSGCVYSLQKLRACLSRCGFHPSETGFRR